MAPAGQGSVLLSEMLCCSICSRLFSPEHQPFNLTCGHSLCTVCVKNFDSSLKCPLDQTVLTVPFNRLPANFALLTILNTGRKEFGPTRQELLAQTLTQKEDVQLYLNIERQLTHMTRFFQYAPSEKGGTVWSRQLSCPVQQKLLTLLSFQLLEPQGRCRAAKTVSLLTERILTEMLLTHRNSASLSSSLWSAVRARGCQFLGPALQDEVLRLILLTFSEGDLISRKTLVMYIVQTLRADYLQVSKTCVGHVVQLLYRASCFQVVKREGQSSLMRLKEEFRQYDVLRHEHDAQIVQIALDAGLRISPDRLSLLLHGAVTHRSSMQAILDELQTPSTLGQTVQELGLMLSQTDPDDLLGLIPELQLIASVEPECTPSMSLLESIIQVISRLIDGYVRFALRRERRKHDPIIDSAVRFRTPLHRPIFAGKHCSYAHLSNELSRVQMQSWPRNGLVQSTSIVPPDVHFEPHHSTVAYVPIVPGLTVVPSDVQQVLHQHQQSLPLPPSQHSQLVPIWMHEHSSPFSSDFGLLIRAWPQETPTRLTLAQQTSINSEVDNTVYGVEPTLWIDDSHQSETANRSDPREAEGHLQLRRDEIVRRLSAMHHDEDDLEHVALTVASSVLGDGDSACLQLPPLTFRDNPHRMAVNPDWMPIVRVVSPIPLDSLPPFGPTTVQASCSVMHIRDILNEPVASPSVQPRYLSPLASFDSVDPSRIAWQTASIVKPFPLMSADPRNVVSDTLDRIVDVKERIQDVEKTGASSTIEKQQLNEEMNIAGRRIQKEINALKTLNHPNILSITSVTIKGTHLCMITPLMDYGSVLDIVHRKYVFGLPELAMAMIIRDVLQAVVYIHRQNIVHRAIRCSHILVSSTGLVCLSGFRCHSLVQKRRFGPGRIHGFSEALQNNLLWLAPEVLKQDLLGYGLASDIYSVGISICEMANGFPPFADMEGMQMLFEKEQGTTPRLLDSSTVVDDSPYLLNQHNQYKRMFSEAFHDLTDLCLKTNPDFRPTADDLLTHQFFKQSKKCKQSLGQLLSDVETLSKSPAPSPLLPENVCHADSKITWDF